MARRSLSLLLGVFAIGLSACATAAPAPRPAPQSATSQPRTPSPDPMPTAQTPSMSRGAANRALLDAAADGDVTAARRAIAARADLETRNAERQTSLIVATKAKHTEVAKLLLDAGADPNAKDGIKDSAFLYAGAEGYNEILRATLRHGADVKSTNRFGGTALIPASEHGHTETVRILIDAGVPLDHVNKLDWTALLEAIVLGDGSTSHLDVVRQLVGAGADPSIRDGQGRTPRQLAAAKGYDAIVEVIDDAEALRERGRQLITASAAGDEQRVKELLARHASVSVRNSSGATALVAAAYGNHLAVAERLLAAGADPNVKDESVQSAYLISTSEVGDDPRLLELLLADGADVTSLDSWHGTGLIRAADRGYAKIIDVLAKTPITLDHVNRIGYTALHEAVVLGDGGPSHQQTVAALLRAGVNTSIRDGSGLTALESARARGYTKIIELLER